MPKQLCCIAEQKSGSDSPELPNARAAVHGLREAEYSSRQAELGFSSTTTQDRRELFRLFESATSPSKDGYSGGETLCPRNVPAVKHPNAVAKLRRRLSKARSKHFSRTVSIGQKSACELSIEEEKDEQTRRGHLDSLLNSASRAHGGYDSDATSIFNADATPRSKVTAQSPLPGRKIRSRARLDSIDWARVPSPASPAQSLIDYDNRGRTRSTSQTTTRFLPRQRSATPTPEASAQRKLQRSRSDSFSEIVPPELLAVLSYSPAASFDPGLNTLEEEGPQSGETSSRARDPSSDKNTTPTTKDTSPAIIDSSTHGDVFSRSRDTTAEESRSSPEKGPNHPPDSAYGEITDQPKLKTGHTLSSADEYIPLLDPCADEDPVEEATNATTRSSSSSVHLYNMRISRHLRPPSSLTDLTPGSCHVGHHLRRHSSISDLRARSSPPLIHHRHQSSSGFASSMVPALWGNVVCDKASSVHDSNDNTPAASALSEESSLEQSATYDIPVQYLPCSTVPLFDGMSWKDLTSPSAEADVQQESCDITTTALESLREDLSPDSMPRLPRKSPSPAEAEHLMSLSLDCHETMQISPGPEEGFISPRTSRFTEEFTEPSLCRPKGKTSIFRMFLRKSNPAETTQNSDITMALFDGPTSSAAKGKQREKNSRSKSAISLKGDDQASDLFAKALLANQEEKNALLLPQNRERASSMQDLHIPRKRSNSVCFFKSADSLGSSQPTPLASHPSDSVHSKPSFDTPQFLTPSFRGDDDYWNRSSPVHRNSTSLDPLDHVSMRRRSSTFEWNSESCSPKDSNECRLSASMHSASDYTENTTDLISAGECAVSTATTSGKIRKDHSSSSSPDLGPWGRYPSHTRPIRTGSAGEKDEVHVYDFAYHNCTPRPEDVEAQPSLGRSFTGLSFLVRSSASNKSKSKIGRSPQTTKSSSMPLAVRRSFQLLRSYGQIFKPQSMEFARHGHGHRSSVSAGGELEHPELEMLPPIFPRRDFDTDNAGIELIDMCGPKAERKVVSRDLGKDATKGEKNPTGPARSQLDGQFDDVEGDRSFSRYDDTRSPSRSLSQGACSFYEPWPRPVTGAPELNSAQFWGQLYASCVELPPSRPDSPIEGVEGRASPVQDYGIVGFKLFASANGIQGITSRSASPPLREREHVQKASCTSSLASPVMSRNNSRINVMKARTLPRMKSPPMMEVRSGCSRNGSVGSALSMRASTNDLCKLLAEAEDRERQRCLRAASCLVEGL